MNVVGLVFLFFLVYTQNELRSFFHIKNTICCNSLMVSSALTVNLSLSLFLSLFSRQWGSKQKQMG